MSPRSYFLHTRQGYICTRCVTITQTHRALARHQFEGPEPCVPTSLLQPAEVDLVDPALEFDGDRVPVPLVLPTSEEFAENRDSAGRLRVSGTLIGYRRWSVGRVDGEFRLFPMFTSGDGAGPYARGVNTAVCDEDIWEAVHRSPDKSCRCGLYAFWSEDDAYGYPSDGKRSTVLGRVSAWGKVLPGEHGFRSEYAMVDAITAPTCIASDCRAAADWFVVRPRWTAPLTPGGRTYPRVNDKRHAAYRETADFASAVVSSKYLGWYCEEHVQKDLIPPFYPDYTCNYPLGAGRRCRRPSAMTLRDVPYSWCHEHAPLVFEAADVIAGLTRYYDLGTQGARVLPQSTPSRS